MTGWFDQVDASLLGRNTYQIFASYWPKVTDPGNPIASKLNALPKYVASTTLQDAGWHNSSLLCGDVAALRLTSTSSTSTDVILATYEPDGPPRYGSFALEDA